MATNYRTSGFSCRWLVLIGCLLGGLAGCDLDLEPAKDATAETPQQAFEDFRESLQQEDWEHVYDLLVPRLQRVMLQQAGTQAVSISQDNPAAQEALLSLFQEQGVELNDPSWNDGTFNPTGKGKLFAALAKWSHQQADGEQKTQLEQAHADFRGAFLAAELVDLETRDDLATATLRSKEATSPIAFRKLEGRWRIDLEPNAEPAQESTN